MKKSASHPHLLVTVRLGVLQVLIFVLFRVVYVDFALMVRGVTACSLLVLAAAFVDDSEQ